MGWINNALSDLHAEGGQVLLELLALQRLLLNIDHANVGDNALRWWGQGALWDVLYCGLCQHRLVYIPPLQIVWQFAVTK